MLWWFLREIEVKQRWARLVHGWVAVYGRSRFVAQWGVLMQPKNRYRMTPGVRHSGIVNWLIYLFHTETSNNKIDAHSCSVTIGINVNVSQFLSRLPTINPFATAWWRAYICVSFSQVSAPYVAIHYLNLTSTVLFFTYLGYFIHHDILWHPFFYIGLMLTVSTYIKYRNAKGAFFLFNFHLNNRGIYI